MITADIVVGEMAKGVGRALQTSQLLLGAERLEFEHPEIQPEYLVTVEAAKALSGPDRTVGLEVLMKGVRENAARTARRHAFVTHRPLTSLGFLQQSAKIDSIVASHTPQADDTDKKRFDIVVFSSERDVSPLLIAEAKLSRQTPAAICKDIMRVAKMLRLHHELEIGQSTYGAVFFYRMLKRGKAVDSLNKRAEPLLRIIDTCLADLTTLPEYSWLRGRAGLLKRGSVVEAIQAYDLIDDVGQTIEPVYSRHGFAFAPGLVLLGEAADVDTVTF